MVEFTNVVYGEPVNYVVSEGGTLGMSRGNKGFFAMGDLNREFETGLPDGEYCDIISECQQKITVSNRDLVEKFLPNIHLLSFILLHSNT